MQSSRVVRLDALDKLFRSLTLTLKPEDDIATPFVPEIEG